MRLADVLATLDREQIAELASRVVPGADRIAPELHAHRLEMVLAQTGAVEKSILAARPPVLPVLLQLIEAEGHSADIDRLASQVSEQARLLSERVTKGELAHRVPDRAGIYRRLLNAAWRDDLVLDSSEARLLDLLREELGLLRTEHFLLAHHDSFLRFWGAEDPVATVIAQLRESGVLFLVDKLVILPEELVKPAMHALGIEAPSPATKRLFARLDSRTHLKTALAEHDLRTSGSKDDRIERLTEAFIPPHRVMDAMHIRQVRDLARSLDVPTSGAKAELVDRVIAHFASGADLTMPTAQATPHAEYEQRVLEQAQFEALFGRLKGRELQQLLLTLGLRHSGKKETRSRTLWDSPHCERSILQKLRNSELNEFLRRLDLDSRGSKAEKIDAILEFAGCQPSSDRPVEAEDSSGVELAGVMSAVAKELGRVDLSSTSPSRFDACRQLLAAELDLDLDEIAFKSLPDPKNYRNRIAEALRGVPVVLVLLARPASASAVLDAARSRLQNSPRTHYIVLCGEGADWVAEGILSATRSPVLRHLVQFMPGVALDLAGLPETYHWARMRDAGADIQRAFNARGRESTSVQQRLLEALTGALGVDDYTIRTKHVSSLANLGNRVSEAIGAGCAGLILVVPRELGDRATEEVSKQLAAARCPTVASVLYELDDGGYGIPLLIGSDGTILSEPGSRGDPHASTVTRPFGSI